MEKEIQIKTDDEWMNDKGVNDKTELGTDYTVALSWEVKIMFTTNKDRAIQISLAEAIAICMT